MSEELDAILQQMQELTTTVKEHGTKSPTLDWSTIEKEFSQQIDAVVARQVEEKMKSAPVRRLPGDPIGHAEVIEPNLLKGNRYRRELKDLQKDGFSKSGTQKIKAIDFYLADMLMSKAASMMPDRIAAPSDDLKNAVKALTSTGTGTGDEIVPLDMAMQLWDDIYLASRIAGNITTIEMPTNPFDVPLGLGDVTWRKGTENQPTTASNPATAKSTLTATELVTEVNWSYTLQEDAVIALMPAIRARLGISGAEIVDSFMLNADSTQAATGNINLDDDTPNADAYYLSNGQDGIRHLWLVDNTGQNNDAGGDALADGDITGALADMGKYGVDPNQVIQICDTSTYLKGYLSLDAVTTLEKFGAGAVVLTGQLAAYRGVPIIISASAPKTESDGKVSVTPGSNTLGQISLLNRMMWYAGFRRQVLVEVDRDIQRREWIMVVSVRPAVAAHGTRSTATHTAGIRNILV